MSEVSREEAIKDIKENVLPCVGGKSLRKAISDMEKLEKIEKIIFRRSDIKTEEQAKASMVVKFMEIEQIVKGE